MNIYPMPPGSYPGRGASIELGENYGEALDFAPPQLQTTGNNLGQKVEFHLTQITSSKELTKSLNISASASLGLGAFSGSAEAKYASKTQINRYSTYLLASVIVHNPDQVIRSPRLKPEAYQLLQNQGWDAFEQRYGTHYLSGYRTGGSYYALIEISTSNKQEQKEIAIAASAAYGTFSAEGKLNRKLTEAIENKSLKVTILQSGGNGDRLEASLETMLEQAVSFPDLVKRNPVVFQGLFEEYRRTVPLPPAIGEGPTTRTHRLTVINELTHRYLKYKDYRANLLYVLDNFSAFEEHLNLNATERQAKITKYQRDFEAVTDQLNDIERLASDCRRSPEACKLPTVFFTPTEPLPNFSEENMLLKELETQVSQLRGQISGLQQTVRPAGAGRTNVRGMVVASGFQASDSWQLRNSGGKLEIRDPRSGKVWARFNEEQSFQLLDRSDLLVSDRVGIGTTSPLAKLDVRGEIRGKMWYRRYTWRRGMPPVRMGHSSKGLAALTWVQGSFAGGGERVSVDVGKDGYWYLHGTSGKGSIIAHGVFWGMP